MTFDRKNVQSHVKPLDGIRGLAVLAVLFFHFGDLSHAHSFALRAIGAVKDAGWIGVDIFFALSGFLITSILYQTRNDTNGAVNFYARRALRLFPLFYGVWIGIALYLFLTHQPWRAGYALYLFYAGNFIAVKYGFVGTLGVAHFWSLAVEEQYYLIWPWLVWKIHNYRTMKMILLGSLLLSFLIKLVLIALHVNPLVAYYTLPTHIESIAMGSFVAFAVQRHEEKWLVGMSRILLPVSAACVVSLGVMNRGLNFGSPMIQLIGYPLLGLLACSLIVRSLEPGSWTARAMTNPVLRFYGRYSYGLYVYNYLLHHLLKKYLYPSMGNHIVNPPVLNVAYLVSCFAILTVISVLSFHLCEDPFLHLKRKFASSPDRHQSAVSPQVAAAANQ